MLTIISSAYVWIWFKIGLTTQWHRMIRYKLQIAPISEEKHTNILFYFPILTTLLQFSIIVSTICIHFHFFLSLSYHPDIFLGQAITLFSLCTIAIPNVGYILPNASITICYICLFQSNSNVFHFFIFTSLTSLVPASVSLLVIVSRTHYFWLLIEYHQRVPGFDNFYSKWYLIYLYGSFLLLTSH